MRLSDVGVILIAVVAAFAFSCGEPLGPAPAAWRQLLVLNNNDIFDYGGKIAVDGDVVYIPYPNREERSVGSIKKYHAGVLTDAYSPALNGALTVSLLTVAIGPKSGWALGYRRFPPLGEKGPVNVPFLVEYANGEWRAENEVNVELAADDFPGAVIPAGTGCCYIEGVSSDTGRYRLYKYENRHLQLVPGIMAGTFIYDPVIDIIYAMTCNGKVVDMEASSDAGHNWIREVLRPRPPVAEFWGVGAAIAPDRSLFIFVQTRYPSGTAVYHRTGDPGEGVYTLCGYFTANGVIGNGDPNDIAVGADGRILVVGEKMSVYFDGGTWREETLPNKNDFDCITAGPGGFYAIANNGMSQPASNKLLYHP